MKSTSQIILDNLNSSLTRLHTVKVGYISKSGAESERVATVNYIDLEKGIVNFATNNGFRSFILDNIIYADIRH
jgi:predicted DNA-binding transcriptional regulator YafY